MSKKVRVAMLGTGGIAKKHADFFVTSPDVEVVACCDVSEQVVQGFFDRVGFKQLNVKQPEVFTDAEKMYKTTKPDAVVICTPHTLHFEHGMQALDHGCHVLMEKPMVTEAAHAYKIKERVDQLKKVFIIGYNTSCSPEFNYLRKIIRDKELGKLELVSGWLTQPWLKYVVGNWRMDPKLSGGGQAYDSGAHILNSLCWSVESNIDSVFAFIDNKGTEVDINSSINIRFTNGVLASIVISGNCPTEMGGQRPHRWGSDMAFIFEHGRVDIDGWGGSWITIWKGNDMVKYPPITQPPLSPAQNFIDAILGRDEARTSPQNGIVQSELMDAIYESAKTGIPSRPKRGR